jgi:carbonic anhydrase
MQKLVTGVHKFQQEVFGGQRDLFAELAERQTPHTLFITCSDSRINPNLLTQTAPGEIFILRNAGNIIPSWGSPLGGEAATIEFAIVGLGIEHVVVCGHSNCGAMKAVLDPSVTEGMPALRKWLAHAEATRQIVGTNYKERSKEELLSVATQENVLVQLENLRTHPAVAARLASGKLHLHGWVYKIGTGEVFGYDPEEGQYRPLGEVDSTPPPRVRSFLAEAIGT